MLQAILDGFAGALPLAPLAAAFAVVHAPTRVFHIAAGAVYALVPYVAMVSLQVGLPLSVAIPTALAVGALISVLLELWNHGPLERRGGATLSHFIASLGAFTIIVQSVVLIWGPDPMAIRTGAHSIVRMGGLRLSTGQITTAAVTVMALGLFYAWIPLSNSGLRLRALASNPAEAALCGINVGSLRLLAFAVSGLLCSTAALANAWDVGFDPYSGTTPILLAIVGAAVGGRYSFLGPLIGMLLIGVVRGVAVTSLSAQWQDVATFLLLALVLYARPGGILAPRNRQGVRL